MKLHFRYAFTLIELLVVIAIISILTAILFPVFIRAKQASYQSACLTNLKQLGLATSLYEADFDDTFPWVEQTTFSGNTPTEIEVNDTSRAMNPYAKSGAVFGDPMNTPMSPNYVINDRLGNQKVSSLLSTSNTIQHGDGPGFPDALPNWPHSHYALSSGCTWLSGHPFPYRDINWVTYPALISEWTPNFVSPSPVSGTNFRLVGSYAFDGVTSTFTWNICHQDFTASYSSQGNPTYTYSAAVNEPQGTATRTGQMNVQDMTWSIVDQTEHGIASNSVVPTDEKSYFRAHGAGSNYLFCDGHGKFMSPDAAFLDALQAHPSWDPEPGVNVDPSNL